MGVAYRVSICAVHTNAQASAAGVIIAHAAAVKRLNPTMEAFMTLILALAVVCN